VRGVRDGSGDRRRRDRHHGHVALARAARQGAEPLLAAPRDGAPFGDGAPDLRQIRACRGVARDQDERGLTAHARPNDRIGADRRALGAHGGTDEPVEPALGGPSDRPRQRDGRERLDALRLIAGALGASSSGPHDRVDTSLRGAGEPPGDRRREAALLRVDVCAPPEPAVAGIDRDHTAGTKDEPDERTSAADVVDADALPAADARAHSPLLEGLTLTRVALSAHC
jgi:hypothetical protein